MCAGLNQATWNLDFLRSRSAWDIAFNLQHNVSYNCVMEHRPIMACTIVVDRTIVLNVSSDVF